MTKRSSGYKTIFISEFVSLIGMTYPAILAVINSFKEFENQALQIIVLFVIFFVVLPILFVSSSKLLEKNSCSERSEQHKNSDEKKQQIINLANFIFFGLLLVLISYIKSLPFRLILEIIMCFALCLKSYQVKMEASKSEQTSRVNQQNYVNNLLLLIVYLACSALITQESSPILASANIINSVIVMLNYYLSDDILMTEVSGKEHEKCRSIWAFIFFIIFAIYFWHVNNYLGTYLFFVLFVWAAINLAYQLFMDPSRKSDNTSKNEEQSEK